MNPNDVNISQATILAGIVLANIGALIGTYVSIRVKIAVLEFKVDASRKDNNALGKLVRSLITTKGV